MTDPADITDGPIDPVRALLDIAPLDEAHPHRIVLELLAPAWTAFDRGETAFLAHAQQEPGPRYMIPMADLCNFGGELVAAAARAAVAGEPRSEVDGPLHRAADLAYLCALARPQLPPSVHHVLHDVTTAFAVGHEPDLYTRVLDTLTPQPDPAAPGEAGDAANSHRFAVAARAIRFEQAVREIRRAQARVAASMVPLARMAAVCLAGTRAPHDVVGGMRRDVAHFVASVDDAARELLADLSAWLAGSPAHHARPDLPGEWGDRVHDALEALRELVNAPARVEHPAEREAAAAATGLRGAGTLRWIEWAGSDVEALGSVLREHQHAVREWHRTIGPAPSFGGPDAGETGEGEDDGGGADGEPDDDT